MTQPDDPRPVPDLLRLPDDLPVPADDGACDHLPGTPLPAVALPSTGGGEVRLDRLPGRTVVFCYPRTGRTGEPSPPGWDEIPGARGCTPETCGFRDLHADFAAIGTAVYGLSAQSTADQREMVARLRVPFEVLSDAEGRLAGALRLPTFEAAGETLLKRCTLVTVDGTVERVFYPVFPPDAHAGEVLAALAEISGR